MNINARKLEMIQRILDCQQIEIFDEIEGVLNKISENTVLEPDDQMYKTNATDLISDSHYMLLEDDRRKHLDGETKGSSWEEVENRLRKKYDL